MYTRPTLRGQRPGQHTTHEWDLSLAGHFHGQMMTFVCHPVSEHGLHYLIDMTDEPTGIRLMLPARTRLVENEAFYGFACPTTGSNSRTSGSRSVS